MFDLLKVGKPALHFSHFPTPQQAFIFRAAEYVPMKKIAQVLRTEESVVRQAAYDLGLPDYDPGQLWLSKGYITIIRRLWHILPYEQLMELLGIDDQELALILREDDFLTIKLGREKPDCPVLHWRELTREEQEQTAKIKKVMQEIPVGGRKPFDFQYDLPKLSFSGKSQFDTRMIYAFSGLYQPAFDVDSRTFCPDELLEAYQKIGINGIWTQGILFRLTPFPFAPEISEGWEGRLENVKDFASRLEKYGIKLYLYLNEPRNMPERFFDQYPHLRGHKISKDQVSMCVSTPEVQAYLTDAVERICRSVPNIGGFFTITRSENPTNCYSHAETDRVPNHYACNCPRCSMRPLEDVIADTIGCIRRGADRVDPSIKVIAWDWHWDDYNLDIVEKLPDNIIVQSQSELDVPFEIAGAKGTVIDYSMGIIGPGERAKKVWAAAKARGLETSAKVQVNTTWEVSTIPALPVYQRIEEHIRGIADEGVNHLMLSWTLGGYPSLSIAHAAKFFYEHCDWQEDEVIRQAGAIFSEAFQEFPFHVDTLYYGPQNAGPSSLLFDTPTGYVATMTCYAYDDLETWRSIYTEDAFESQFTKLCEKWEKGLALLKDVPDCETVRMAKGAYALFCSSRDQIRFYRARKAGNREEMLRCAKKEEQTARDMLQLMQQEPAIGFEAANHYYFSQGQLMEKIINCRYLTEKLSRESGNEA